jgi:hypothetical protein
MMKRSKIISIIVLSVTVLSCGFVGWLLIKAVVDKNAAERARNDDFSQLTKIYRGKVFPSRENIEQIKEDQKELEQWLATTAELLHRGDLPESSLTPATFKQKLQAAVRQLSRQPGIRRGRVVAQGFNFGFDQYLGESDSLPDKDHVARLDRQLGMIELVSQELYAAQILALDSVGREVFDVASAVAEEPESGRRPNRRRAPAGGAETQPTDKKFAAAQLDIPDGMVSKERFTFEFTATPEAYIAALNRLAAMDLFVVVAESSFQKTGDQLKVMDEKPKSLEDGSQQKEHAQKSYAERTVTNPKLDPPVSVKLVVDVYTFEGV